MALLNMIWFLRRYQKLVEGGLGNNANIQEVGRSSPKYTVIDDETAETFELEDDTDHVL